MSNFKFQILGCLLFLGATLLVPFARADQNLTVTGTIAPKDSDFQLSMSPSTSSTIPQQTAVTYTITYGSHLGYADSMTITAHWGQGTLQGASTPSVDGMDYVAGSASSAYGGVTPVINVVNQTITWTIPSFPASTTDRTVSFQLKTTGSFTGTSPVTFPIQTRLTTSNFVTSYQSSITTYQFDSSLIPATPTTPQQSSTQATTPSSPTTTPLPTTKPTLTTTPTTTSRPLPKPQPTATATSNAPIQNLSIVNLTDSSTQIAVDLNKVTSATVIYGISPASLTATTQLAIIGSQGTINLDSLNANTTYYMQVVTKDTSGNTKKSEVFAVPTAQSSPQPHVAAASLVVASDNEVLYSAGLNNGVSKPLDTLTKTPQIPIAQDTNYTFAFKLTKQAKMKTVSMTLQNTSVLGISTFHPIAQPLTYSFPVISQDNGNYSVQIKNPTVAGTYDVYIHMTDYDGNMTTQKVAEIRVLKPFRVYNARTKRPIEDARIVLYRYNQDTKKFDLVPNYGGVSNPLYTNSKGEVSESLSKGMYKASFGRIGYIGKDNITFSVGTTPKDDFPTVYLTPTPITPLAVFIYYRNAFVDYFGATNEYIAAIQQSYRYFDVIGLSVIVSFIIVSFLLFRMKSHIAFSHIPYYLHHHGLMLVGHKESPYLFGTIVDKSTRTPLGGAAVFVIEEVTGKVVSQVTTTKTGGFLLPFDKAKRYTLSVMKEGYEPSGLIGYTPDIRIPLTAGETTRKKVVDLVAETTENALGLFFEFMLVLSLLMEVLIFPAFGLWKTVPFLCASLLNVVLWALYLRERGKQLSVN